MKTHVEKRPWGEEHLLSLNKISTVKILIINAKQRFSLQYHNNREEFWELLDNSARITLGRKTFIARKGDTFLIKRKQLHRIQALGKQVKVLEVSFGKFREKDIVRIEDDYGRI